MDVFRDDILSDVYEIDVKVDAPRVTIIKIKKGI